MALSPRHQAQERCVTAKLLPLLDRAGMTISVFSCWPGNLRVGLSPENCYLLPEKSEKKKN